MKIDVITPVYNTPAAYLFENIFSLLNQTILPNRIIIVDDGSTNQDTLDALNYLQKNYPIIALFKTEHSGTPSSLNVGHNIATTEFVSINGSDDINHPRRLEKQIDFLNNNPDTDVLGCSLYGFNTSDIFRKSIFSLKHDKFISSTGLMVNHGGSVYRLSKAVSINSYNPLLLREQDIDFFNRMYLSGAIIRNIPDFLYLWRRY